MKLYDLHHLARPTVLFEYMYPGFKPYNGRVSCFRYFEHAKEDVQHAISYKDIQNLVENPPPMSLFNGIQDAKPHWNGGVT